MTSQLVKIERSDQTVILPQAVFDKIYATGRYLTVNTKRQKTRIYYQVMVCKKEKSKLVERITLSRYMLDVTDKKIYVDHIDGNPLNNCYSNLRLATASQNQANRKKSPTRISIFKGVSHKKGSWFAAVKKNGISYSAGAFKSQIAAAKAYDLLARTVHGQFALTNFDEQGCAL